LLDARRRSPGARRKARKRLRLLRTLVAITALAVIVAWITGSGSGPGPGAASASQATVRVTLPHVAVVAPATAASVAPALPWPKTGESAVAIPALGYAAQSGPERPVPVASMTKIMTAYVVLEDHPLALGQPGPRVKMTAADAAQFGTDTVTDQANVLLKAGEVLTEYQMLEGLLVHSANDLAYALANWDAGSVGAFVAKMNSTAKDLGMNGTHFADASGFSPSSESTASDLLRVAAVAMTDPVFAQIVAMPAASLPLAGTVGTYTPLVGTTGVVGVKSGFTNAAGGGDVLAYKTTVGGHAFLALAAVTSQEMWTVLGFSGKEDLAVARAAAARVESVTMVPAGTTVAKVKVGSRTVDVKTSAAVSVLAFPGETVRQSVHVRAPRPGTRRGTQVGTATFVLATQRVSVPVRVTARVP
jgi:D-alanyl-D-alanine carboxypeptidase (penicillin-binding protein 5/6)